MKELKATLKELIEEVRQVQIDVAFIEDDSPETNMIYELVADALEDLKGAYALMQGGIVNEE